MAFLLDTNAWIVYLRSAQSPIRARLEGLTPADVFLCSVIKAELLHGAEKYGLRERRLALLTETFAPYASLPFDDLAAAVYGRVRHELETDGHVALVHGLTLVTHNTREFARIAGLQTENWQT